MKVEFSGLHKRYGQTRAVDGIDFAVPEGVKVVALVGPSGGGKSTLLRLIGGLEVPDAGEVRIAGEALGRDSASLLAHRRRNGFLFQAFNLFPHLSALANVMLPLVRVHEMDELEAREKAEVILDRFCLLDHAAKQPAQLSGGQQQRVALARAVAVRPSLLLLDEPTSALDPEMTAEVLELIEELCHEGQEVILSTHELGFARAVADQVLFLSEGRLLEEGPADRVFCDPQTPELQRFLAKVMRY